MTHPSICWRKRRVVESIRAGSTGQGRRMAADCSPLRRACVNSRLLVLLPAVLAVVLLDVGQAAEGVVGAGLQAGAAVVDIAPPKLPVLQNGGFLQQTADRVTQPLYARALTLADEEQRLAICVVDSCMLSRELCDEAKQMASAATGIPVNRMLISATHTHSAPATMRCLGCPADPEYPEWLVPRIAECITRAAQAMRPAQAGWGVIDAGFYTNTRRWIFLPHRMQSDPFGQVSVRAMMHPGHANPDTAGPAGPIDPDLTVLSIQDREGRPLAILGNFSMHYYGASGLSSDYTGRVCQMLEEAMNQVVPGDAVPCVALMSQGTSGDLHFMDYSIPQADQPFQGKPDGFERYCRGLTDLATKALQGVSHRSDVKLAMAEATLKLGRRAPDLQRLAWADPILAQMPDLPRNLPEVYALEARWLHEHPEAELKLQAIRIGELGITAIPNEVYGVTGVKLKMQSPLKPTMNLELANGGEGYIPPPEQHQLGGYTTWPARTAGLEVQAEPQIVQTVLELLEQVSGLPRRCPDATSGAYAHNVLAAQPYAYWTLDQHSGASVVDVTGQGRDAALEPGYALFLPGPSGDVFTGTERGNRAVHFAGGRLRAETPELSGDYSAAFWFCNAMPADARAVAGYLFSRGREGSSEGDHLGIGGTAMSPAGRLLFYNGDTRGEVLAGRTDLELHRWYHVVLVREAEKVRVYLDGNPECELQGSIRVTRPGDSLLFIGGRSDGLFSFEGKLDEVAIFPRAWSADEVTQLYRSAER